MLARFPLEIGPILSTLRRHKTAAALIVLEIALSCAIICNAVFLISQRVERIGMPSGVAEDEVVHVQITGIGRDENPQAMTTTDLAALRAIPGVKSAAVTNQVPFTNSSWNNSVSLTPDQERPTLNATMYLGSETLLDTLGTRLLQGRLFTADEYIEPDPAQGFGGLEVSTVVITKAMADRLFPGQPALGKAIYMGDDKPVRIIGIIDHLVRPSLSNGEAEDTMILPLRVPYTMGGNYLIRTTPDQRERVLKDAVAALEKTANNRIILNRHLLSDMREHYFRQDRSMVWLLVAVCVALLVVTALGIVGLASFWVQQRTKQIGVRRALGATRGQVLRYFQTENFVLATLGIVIGMGLAFGLNQVLMSKYELPRLPALYLPVGALALWLLGQVAVFGPARRAAAVPPAVATRTV